MEQYENNKPTHTNSSLEQLTSHRELLRQKRDSIRMPYEEITFKIRYANPEESVGYELEKQKILETLANNTELARIEEEIFQINKEIILRHRKDLANNYLVTQMVMNDLYEQMFSLPEGDSRLEEIERRIFEIEALLSEDKQAMGKEGLSSDRVESGSY